MIHKKIVVCFAVTYFGILSAQVQKTYIWRQELNDLRNRPSFKLIFDKEAHPILREIRRDIENYAELTLFQRFVRSTFIEGLNCVVVTPKTMPTAHAYIDELCKKSGIKTPTVFISLVDGMFNAMAQKLLASSGAIMMGQKLVEECSDQELEAVMAHEIGHIKHNHINKRLFIHFGINLPVSVVLAWKLCNKIYDEHLRVNEKQLAINIAVLTGLSLLPIISNLLIGKRFEKEADLFACEAEQGEGLIKFFEKLIQKDEKYEQDFEDTKQAIEEVKDQFSYSDYTDLHTRHTQAVGLYKLVRWLYYRTPLGAHPSHQDRIKAVQQYLHKHAKQVVVS